MSRWRLALIVLFFSVVAGLYLIGVHESVTVARIRASADMLESFVRGHYWQSIGIYFFVFIGATVLLVPITVPLTILAGFLFGTAGGTLYALVGATIGAVILSMAARYLLRDSLQKKYHKELARFDRTLRVHGVGALVLANLLPASPTAVMYVLAGLSDLPLYLFALANAFGLFPGTFLYAYAGSHLLRAESMEAILAYELPIFLVLATVVFCIFFALPFLYRRVRGYRRG